MEAVSELSPVSELSSCMQSLLCQDSSLSPRRRLTLTPEPKSPERNQGDQRGQLPETPTVSRRRAPSRASPPQRPSLKLRWRRARCLRGETGDDEDDEDGKEKENHQTRKRVRVKLFSKSSPESEEEAGSRNKRTHHSSPEEGAVHLSETEPPDPASVALFQRLRSRRKSAHRHIPTSAITDQRLIGDFSKRHVLPVEHVGHQELHCVSAQTVSGLIRGQFSSVVEDFLIIDCRYPYEYQGGHIKGAVNLYTEAQIRQAFLQSFTAFQTSPEAQRDPPNPGGASAVGMQGMSSGGTQAPAAAGEVKDGGSSPRKLIVFHCEFSSERGPRLCQYLRELDRAVNAQAYPLLLYPELYLLQGGYKHFYKHSPELCEPCSYVPMRHRDFREQLHRFSRKRRSHHRRRPVRSQQRAARF
ncbi:cell division cycle 25 homolog d [Salminus brasiliensis]|uniref:cell division cycle 25 homolog d n=1 Tax=Salminus brasiliensis TaxID=930266 RepID=UPI003B8383D7